MDKLTPGLIRTLNESNEEYEARRKQLDATAPDLEHRGADIILPAHMQNKAAPKGAHFSEKVYFFPPSFNALREELETNYPTWFNTVVPGFGISPAYAMVYNAPQFVGFCNGAVDSDIQFDSEDVAGICHRLLNRFRAMRGASPISE